MTPRPVFAVLNRTIPLRHIPVCAQCGAASGCEHGATPFIPKS